MYHDNFCELQLDAALLDFLDFACRLQTTERVRVRVQTAQCTLHHAVHINRQKLGNVGKLNLNIGIGNSLPTIGRIYVFIGGVSAPFGRRVGKGSFSQIKTYSLEYFSS